MWNLSGDSQAGGDLQLQQQQEEQREQELASSFWADVLQGGGTMMKHTTNSRGSALRILDEVLENSQRRHKNMVLAIQREMVDLHLPVVETTAGRHINQDLTNLRDQLQAELAQTRKEIREAQEKHDEETARYLKGIEQDFRLKLQTSEAENQELRLSLEEVYRKMEEKVVKALEQMNTETKAAIEAKEDELRDMESSTLYIAEEVRKAQRAAEQRADLQESERKKKEMQEMKAEYEKMLRDMKAEIAALKLNKEKKESTGKKVLSSLASGTASGLASGIASAVLPGKLSFFDNLMGSPFA
ncbi:hypothetical protein EG329_000744 [Mollisiaceae sp. DMI_Dod_QoI]|nr:hypothetical protein EG329_000744 [Helotiales sp. DMI_Dod_QoI]